MEKRRISSSKTNIVRPPKAVDGMDLRTWLAGCALSNSNVIAGAVSHDEAIKQAMEFADKMMEAMKMPASPKPSTLKPPSNQTMEKWEHKIAADSANKTEKREHAQKQTVPAVPLASRPPRETIQPPFISADETAVQDPNKDLKNARMNFSQATQTLRRASNSTMKAIKPEEVRRNAGFYKMSNLTADTIPPPPRKT